MKKCCDMKGMLSFICLRLISKQAMSGEDIRKALEQRKGTRPSPGTIYPVLKSLQESGWIIIISKGKEKKYELTTKGRLAVKEATRKFVRMFCDMKGEF
ncbi:MAG: PadR family transcriptional regulator [Candidatus Woesearchaeota archaeon]|jgi:DNA-binding PadR family transcriptional regulator|nr:PadR family transcriptional regulator [Candidatus Woesearchaeota archaeon]MDP7181575.1 PadR family transcriptional regulator [Candidatus Woesearchaeota archaeon]MDP7198617.1 PadR family transcriptional regulator [Candidatus Woesearchaeota archaeon]MDP7466641.1 PadR family transcriptional regulator [Candidatus Woesearchaeota archaeon]MDP7646897.1 PadR family transcriptional regulator [Candidatus Woesearchaeota archaeon]|tara:strand:+ start:139 stop:435 length:297 start_codon:yes stop_codon:yes gene_type:complete